VYKILANYGFASNFIHYLPSCHSTNEIAANLVGNGLEEGMVVITDDQTHGKGQRGNYWESEPYANLTFSLALKPTFLLLQNQFRLTQVISLSIASVVQEKVSSIVKIKWPNDIYVNNKKLGGILIQNNVKGKELEFSIIGIGLNLNQAVFANPKAISLFNLTQKTFDNNSVLNEIIYSISNMYNELKKGNYKHINEEYQKLLFAKEEVKTFETNIRFSGKIIGTDQIGRLLVQTSDGVKCYQNQEIKLIG